MSQAPRRKPMTLGERLRKLRQDRQLPQDDVARAIGVRVQAVSEWERGEAEPRVASLRELAKLFGVTLDELIGRE